MSARDRWSAVQHNYDDNLAVAPIRAPDKERAVPAYTSLRLHDRFFTLFKKKSDKILAIRGPSQAGKKNLQIARESQPRLSLRLKRRLPLSNQAKAGVAKRAAHAGFVASQTLRQSITLRGIRCVN